MAEKILSSRIVHKHDIAANWSKAVNFVPRQGELIVYDVDADYAYERIKVGDGTTSISALPFVDDALRSTLVELINAVDDKADAVSTLVGDTAVSEQITNAINSHDHDDRYYTIEEMDEALKFVDVSAGEFIVVDDSAEQPLQNLVLYGKTIQNGNPTPDAPVALSSIGGDGSITVNVVGKNLIDINALAATTTGVTCVVDGNAVQIATTTAGTWRGVKSGHMMLVAGKTYTMSAIVDAITSGVASIGFRKSADNQFVKRSIASGTGSLVVSYTPTENIEVYASLLCTDGTSADGDVTYSDVMLEAGDAATAYESYKGVPITITTPNGLPGIPVANGGNYTDVNGQQWVCDEIDLTRKVYVQRVDSLIVDGTMCSYSSSAEMAVIGLPAAAAKLNYINNIALCTHYPYGKYANADMPDKHFKIHYVNSTGVTTLYFKNTAYTSVDEWAAALAADPVTVLYMLETPVETDLSDVAYSMLYSQHPITTIYSDCGVEFNVSYATDRIIDVKAALGPIYPGIYIGADEPTDESIRVWINTAEEGTGIIPVLPRVATITLTQAGWAGSASPYSQVVEINTVTSATKIDLQPTVAQIVSLQNDDIALMAENDDGVVTIYSFGGKPSADMTMQVMLTEVSYV